MPLSFSHSFLVSLFSLSFSFHHASVPATGPSSAQAAQHVNGACTRVDCPSLSFLLSLPPRALAKASSSYHQHLTYFTCRKDLAITLRKQFIVYFWGITVQRGWARLILDRLGAPVHGSAASARENAAGHVVTPPNTLTSSILTTYGTANSAGFG